MRSEIGAQSSARVVVNGVRLAYDDRGGTGPVLLCLHALGHGARDFAPLCERLGSRYRVIALDWPGQGASDSESAPPTSARYAEHLVAFVSALGLEPCVLLGNSIGGAAAIEFAARHPERVRALIVANPGGLFMRRFGATLVVRAVATFFAAGAAGGRWFPAVFASLYRHLLRGDHALPQRERIVAAGRELAPLLAAGWRAFAEPASDLRELAKQVTAPVLVVWSTGDPLNRLAFNRAGIRNFPAARLECFAGGHAPFLETPDAFVRVFDEFIAEVAQQRQHAGPSHSIRLRS